MGKFKLCFVFDENGEYKPIPYSKFMDGDMRRVDYEGRFFLPLNGYLLEVSQQDYREYYREQRRQRYLRSESVRCGEMSFQEFCCQMGSRRAISYYLDVEEIVLLRDEIENLNNAVAALTESERQLIRCLFFDEQTERQCAKAFGVCQRTIQARKRKVLSKLQKFLRKSSL